MSRSPSKKRNKHRRQYSDEDRRQHLRNNWGKVLKIVKDWQKDCGKMPFAVLIDLTGIYAVKDSAGVVRHLTGRPRLQRELVTTQLDDDDCFVLVLMRPNIMRVTFRNWEMRTEAEARGIEVRAVDLSGGD